MFFPVAGLRTMESMEKWHKDFIAFKLLDKKCNSKRNGVTGE